MLYRTDRFGLNLPAGHRFPADKYQLLAQALAPQFGTLMHEAPPASQAELLLAHTPAYVAAVFAGQLSEAEQRQIGFPWSPHLLERSCRTTGASIAAAHSALEHGLGINLAGGTHHAFADHGSGFCVFNDVAVAARVWQQAGRVRRILVIDLDVHQGNGTAAIFADDPSVFTFSMHGARNFPFDKRVSDWDIELSDGMDDAEYLHILQQALPELFERARPDLVFYVAGVDPYHEDRLGRLALSRAGLAERDRMVVEACRSREIGVAISMAGGYTNPVSTIVDLHCQTVTIALACFGVHPEEHDHV